jgi:dTDP-4-dehydrorhamnose reductase
MLGSKAMNENPSSINALVTGLKGTVAPVFAKHLAMAGHVITPWDRAVVPVDDFPAIREFIHRTSPDWFFHFATGSPAWAEMVAQVCAEEGVKFLFSSSVSVFSNSQYGPFTVDMPPAATDEYGRYKIECERLVRNANPDAIVARLGWQIGTTSGSNNMVDFLDRTVRTQGYVEASRAWYPACSFLKDTAESMMQLM